MSASWRFSHSVLTLVSISSPQPSCATQLHACEATAPGFALHHQHGWRDAATGSPCFAPGVADYQDISDVRAHGGISVNLSPARGTGPAAHFYGPSDPGHRNSRASRRRELMPAR